MKRGGNRSVKIAVSIPDSLFREVERVRRKTRRPRSAVVAEAIECWLARSKHADRVRRDEEGYRRYPETEEEIRAAELAASDILAEIPWEE
ncbi:MAG TPA: hypothetical protein VKF62_11500 [Planctomycetota bacterium]|nr:hypothetical protein [Planctomycetota bacterium]